jgi:hypothetical protein
MNQQLEEIKQANNRAYQKIIDNMTYDDLFIAYRKEGETFEDYKKRREFSNFWLKHHVRKDDRNIPFSEYKTKHDALISKVEQPLLSSFLKDNEGI